MVLTRRLRRRIQREFSVSTDEIEALLRTAECGGQDVERVLAAIVLMAHGDIDRLRQAVELSQVDWRDVLGAGELADPDWAEVLDERLGPAAP